MALYNDNQINLKYLTSPIEYNFNDYEIRQEDKN